MLSSSNQETVLARAASRGWVSLRQFARLIDVSYPTACRMRDRGDFRVVKVGGIYRIAFDEIRRFLRDGNIQSEPSVELEPELNGGEKSPPPLPTHPRDD